MQARFEDKILFWTTGLERFNDEILKARIRNQRVYLDLMISETREDSQKETIMCRQIDITPRLQGTRLVYAWRYYTLWERAGGKGTNAMIVVTIILGDNAERQKIPVCTLTNKGWVPPHQTYAINKMSPVSGRKYKTRVIRTIAKRLEEIEHVWRMIVPADEIEAQEIKERIMLINKAKWNWLGLLEGEE